MSTMKDKEKDSKKRCKRKKGWEVEGRKERKKERLMNSKKGGEKGWRKERKVGK